MKMKKDNIKKDKNKDNKEEMNKYNKEIHLLEQSFNNNKEVITIIETEIDMIDVLIVVIAIIEIKDHKMMIIITKKDMIMIKTIKKII